MKVSVMLVAALAAMCGCATSMYSVTLKNVERSEANISRAMRGAMRTGCEVSETYDSLLGIFIECKEGRIVVGQPSGADMKLPGKPVALLCTRDLSDKEVCEAKWRRIYEGGEAPCKDAEHGPGCGPLQCSGGTANYATGEKASCEQALDPFSPKYCPTCQH